MKSSTCLSVTMSVYYCRLSAWGCQLTHLMFCWAKKLIFLSSSIFCSFMNLGPSPLLAFTLRRHPVHLHPPVSPLLFQYLHLKTVSLSRLFPHLPRKLPLLMSRLHLDCQQRHLGLVLIARVIHACPLAVVGISGCFMSKVCFTCMEICPCWGGGGETRVNQEQL